MRRELSMFEEDPAVVWQGMTPEQRAYLRGEGPKPTGGTWCRTIKSDGTITDFGRAVAAQGDQP